MCQVVPFLTLFFNLICQRGKVSLHGLQDEATLDCLQQQVAGRRHIGNHLQERGW